MNYNWMNGIKAFSLILVIFLLSIKHQISAQELSNSQEQQLQQQELQNINEVKRNWKKLQSSGWGKKRNMLDYSADRTQRMIPPSYQNIDDNYADIVRNYDYDTSKINFNDNNIDDSPTVDKRAWKVYNTEQGALKRGPGVSWNNNLRNAGYGKREPGNWQNLRGLWGKRSSWGRLQGSWGRK